MKKAYYENRPENEISARFGSYRLNIRYFANCDGAQISLYNLSNLRFPLEWSKTVTDKQANIALNKFEKIGYFEMM